MSRLHKHQELDDHDDSELELFDTEAMKGNRHDDDDEDDNEHIFSVDSSRDVEDDAPLLSGSPPPQQQQRKGGRKATTKPASGWARQWIGGWFASGPVRSRSQQQRRRRFPRLRGCLCRCFVVGMVGMVAFFLFGYFYFRPPTLPAPTVADKSTDTTARFLTLNIFMRPPGVKNNKSDYKEDRLDYIIKYILPNYDVIAIQEAFAFANRRIDRLQIKARQLGFNHQVASPRHYPWELAADGGLLLLSRFPIKTADVLEFPRGIHADWMSKKGALHALVELNATRSVHVYTTHTQASYDKAGAFSQDDIRIRLSQFALVHDFMRDTARDDGAPIVLMGDLNVDASAHLGAKTDPSVESSQAYTMMVGALNGTGITLDGQRGVYADNSWLMDTMVDAVYNQFKYHVVTFGDIRPGANGSSFTPGENVLTHWDQLMTMQSIDRIFWAGRHSTDLSLSNITIEKFLVDENKALTAEERQNIHFTQISDHYGLSCLVSLV